MKIGTAYTPPQSRHEERTGDGHYRHFQPAPTRDMERLQRSLMGPYHGTHYGDLAVTIACVLGAVVVAVLGLGGWL